MQATGVDLETAVRKSWQSFSTMRRFVSEAERLENASWRVWFMQQKRGGEETETIEPSHASIRHGQSLCVYCELRYAQLSCRGCCHDTYCVSCFKLIHKKGNLATHTAVRVTAGADGSAGQEPELEAASSADDRSDKETKSPAPPRATDGSTTSQSMDVKVKPWEVQMDVLIQRLMMNSLHESGDISIRNIDRRDSLNLTDVHAGHSDTTSSEDETPSKTKEEDTKTMSPTLTESVSSSTSSSVTGPSPLQLPQAAYYKSPKRASVCANCGGDHIMINCPLLETSLSASGSTVDTALRKCFTTIHNDNTGNSAHAFLGDEMSLHGAQAFQRTSSSTSFSSASSFGMNSIAEDSVADIHDTTAVLTPVPSSPEDPKWDASSWFVPCLATSLPSDVFTALREAQKQNDGMHAWAWLKQPGRKWSKRFVTLSRNCLWEYLDEKESSRPIGFANVTDASVVHFQPNSSPLEFALKYYRTASMDGGALHNECWMQLETQTQAGEWFRALSSASTLSIEDLFVTDFGDTELGRGRFSVVKQAQRRQGTRKQSALKIMDKDAFWKQVARETERPDTVAREILTQAVLTVRAEGGYCPVIRLLSLFETRQLLVLELELMHSGDLHDEIVQNTAVDENRASYLIASLVQAVGYCQQNGVAHRDIKLSNLALHFVESTDHFLCYSLLKIADFGMAAFIQPDGKLKGRCGTPGFVAPEILLAGKGEAYPGGVDMFSVGVVAYTMLCGYEPFFGVNDEELIRMNKSVEYEFEDPEWIAISPRAKDLIARMMEKDTENRITAQEALDHPFLKQASSVLESVLQNEDSLPLQLL